MKTRRLALIGLIFLVAGLVLALPACGLFQQSSDLIQGSTSGITSGEPGSGSWSPARPTNARQCTQVYNADTTLIDRTFKLADTWSTMVTSCYKADGSRIKDSNNTLCSRDIKEVESSLQNHIKDTLTGYNLYNKACDLNGAPELSLPSNFPILGVEDPQPEPTRSCCYCLTCTLIIEDYYAFEIIGAPEK